MMKKCIVAVLLSVYGLAMAACPKWSPYNCVPGPNGKQICGCGK